jgi:hypothetical protein
MLLKQRLIASRFLQAICRIEKNIFSVVPMPFGQRSLVLADGLICAFTAKLCVIFPQLPVAARSGKQRSS